MESLEGRQSILAGLQARQRRFQLLLVSQSAHREKLQDVIEEAERQGVPVRYADRRELDAMAHGATHGGLVAVCSPKPRLSVSQLLDLVDRLTEPPLLLLIEGIEDARNLGFVIRTAEAVGCHAVLVKKHLWDLDPVEVARPASGAFEKLPLVQVEDVAPLRALQGRGIRLVGCLAGARRTCYGTALADPVMLAVGGEKRGLSGAVREICDAFCSIPSRPGASSLSLSHAAAILMGEVLRQRSAADGRTPAGAGTAAASEAGVEPDGGTGENAPGLDD